MKSPATAIDPLWSLPDGIEYRVKEYQKGDIVARQGDPCKGLYLLTKGKVKTEMISENGGLLSIEKINAVRPLAPAFIFAEASLFPVDVTAVENCEVIFVSKEQLIKIFEKDSTFLEKYLKFNAEKSSFLSGKLSMLTVKTIRSKLSLYFLAIYYQLQKTSPGATVILLDKNQTELAKSFGVTRPALARELRGMENDGLIKVTRKEVRITNFEKLKEAGG
jgi:CRP-like cAMP-binding protein